MLNTAILMGRLTADPELRHTPSDVAVTSFTLAVDRSYVKSGADRQVDFIDIVAWRSTAEFVCRYFHKGQLVAVQGSIQIRKAISARPLKWWLITSTLPSRNGTAPILRLRRSRTPIVRKLPSPPPIPPGIPAISRKCSPTTICRFNVNYKDKIRRIIPWLIDRKDPKEITAAAAVKAVRRFAASV